LLKNTIFSILQQNYLFKGIFPTVVHPRGAGLVYLELIKIRVKRIDLYGEINKIGLRNILNF
jgi:hypothetical protein